MEFNKNMFLRKFLLIAILLILNENYAYAETRSSTADFQKALSYSINSLKKTDDYLSALTNKEKNFEILLQTVSLCEYEYKNLKLILDKNVVREKESRVCVFSAVIILQERHLALSYMKDSVYSKAEGNNSSYDYYLNESLKYIKSADELRRKFKNTYGY